MQEYLARLLGSYWDFFKFEDVASNSSAASSVGSAALARGSGGVVKHAGSNRNFAKPASDDLTVYGAGWSFDQQAYISR